MSEILVPQMVVAKPFESLTAYGHEKALRACLDEGYDPTFIPSVIDARILAGGDNEVWKWYSSPSAKITGRTKQNNDVVVISHTANYLSNPDNLASVRELGLINGAGKVPQPEFQHSVDMDGITNSHGDRLVWVVDYATVKSAKSGTISVDEALEHSLFVPFLGGEDKARRYLEKHKEVYGDSIWVYNGDDLHSEGPLGRGLGLNNDYLDAYLNLDDDGRVLGVRAEGATSEPTLPVERLVQLSKQLSQAKATIDSFIH